MKQKVSNKENSIQFLTDSIKSNLCDYSDAYILVIGDITVTGGNEDTKVAFTNCTPFKTCRAELNVFVNDAQYIYIAIHMYNLIEYSDNYSDTSGSLWQCKRDEIDNNANLSTDSLSFKYKSNFTGNLAADEQ